ncbi:hypothetical protein [Candidatus Nitrosocosmicus arcticus]|uniref:Uncharacterized protein n=1 Tax=Candidatus Nitrosocosmicus arcticus TaxID=2035267 RepID=A0A557SXI3_9ARCH|nr:hypothetical protein [Candidatus Nitrosocosmicus arcticus]TVP41317.1 hypothetical protein NARC_30031 [Candidatus Nitrosocosmicus arcticus]
MSELSNNSENENKNNNSDQSKNSSKERTSQWSELISGIIDKLTGKDLQVSYSFENLEVEIPKAYGPDGKQLGGAKWRVDGKITISTELINEENK